MDRIALHANCFDASALVKLHVEEEGSALLRTYFNRQATKYATPFCFYEALNVLKVKWLYRQPKLSREQYLDACFALCAWYGASSSQIEDPDFTSPTVFAEAQRPVAKTSLDLSDAFQIVSVKSGYFSHLVGGSQTVLVTGDKDLAAAARDEGLRAWYFLEEPAP